MAYLYKKNVLSYCGEEKYLTLYSSKKAQHNNTKQTEVEVGFKSTRDSNNFVIVFFLHNTTKCTTSYWVYMKKKYSDVAINDNIGYF